MTNHNDQFICVLQHSETSKFHGGIFQVDNDANGYPTWTWQCATKAYDTEVEAASHMAVLKPSLATLV